MLIYIVNIGGSPYNRSIWTGIARAFQFLGHRVEVFSHETLPKPELNVRMPELVFAVHGGYIPAELVEAYRDAGVVTAVYLLDEPYEVDRSIEWSQHYDWAFSADRATVPLHAQRTSAAFLPLGYDAEIFRRDGPSVPSDILVLGSPFPARTGLLQTLAARWGDRVTWVGPGWKQHVGKGRFYDGFVTPEICAQFYRGARISINIHRDSTWSHFGDMNSHSIFATHLNPRFWETAACGTLQLCTPRDDIQEFVPRSPVFSSYEDLESKIEYYLAHERAVSELATRVWKKMGKHDYRHRVADVLKVVFK